MKFETQTINVLKNYASINDVIMFRQGNVLRTIASGKSIASKATLNQSFPQDFGIYNLSQFLNVLSLFKEPEVQLEDKYCIVKGENGTAVRYVYGDEATMTAKVTIAPDKDFVLPDQYLSFNLKHDDFNSVLKAAAVLGVEDFAFVGDGQKLYVQALNASLKKGGNVFSIVIGETDKKFQCAFKVAHLKLINQDYDVTLSSEGITHFKSSGDNPVQVEYWVPIEVDNSNWG